MFDECVIFYVWSNGLRERMHRHIGCICTTFLHCVFSNGSSNCLLDKKHSYIGCICVTFLLHEFSNVSSNYKPMMLNTHIGCTYLAWCHCLNFHEGPSRLYSKNLFFDCVPSPPWKLCLIGNVFFKTEANFGQKI